MRAALVWRAFILVTVWMSVPSGRTEYSSTGLR
jgi:hypothetical protein